MIPIIPGIGVVLTRVDTVHIIDITIGIVVDAIALLVHTFGVRADLPRVPPHIGGEIFMIIVDSGIDRRDHDVGAASTQAPGHPRANSCESPLFDETRIVGH